MTDGTGVLKIAAHEIGVKESPANSNNVKYNTWFYGRAVKGSAYPWCMAFVQWCFHEAGTPLPYLTASCGALLNWYRRNQPECVTADPEPGCLAIFDFTGAKKATSHVGIVEGASGGNVTTIDGNTGTGNEANGGAVMRRTRGRQYVTAFIRPITTAKEQTKAQTKEQAKNTEKEADSVKRYQSMEEIRKEAAWAAETIEKLLKAKALGGSGAGLDLSEEMLRVFVVNDRMGLYH